MKTPFADRESVRNENVVVSVSKKEKEALKKVAESQGLSLSSYVRQVALQKIKEEF